MLVLETGSVAVICAMLLPRWQPPAKPVWVPEHHCSAEVICSTAVRQNQQLLSALDLRRFTLGIWSFFAGYTAPKWIGYEHPSFSVVLAESLRLAVLFAVKLLTVGSESRFKLWSL